MPAVQNENVTGLEAVRQQLARSSVQKNMVEGDDSRSMCSIARSDMGADDVAANAKEFAEWLKESRTWLKKAYQMVPVTNINQWSQDEMNVQEARGFYQQIQNQSEYMVTVLEQGDWPSHVPYCAFTGKGGTGPVKCVSTPEHTYIRTYIHTYKDV